MKTLRTSGLREAVAAMVVLVGCVTGAQAFPQDTPSPSSFGVLDGDVLAIKRHGGLTYIGGSFSELAAITGAFARLDAATGRRSALLPEAENGEVRASVPDGQGGFYIGGTFTAIGGVPRTGIGHILANGTLDRNFNPGVSGTSTPAVNALAVSGDGRTLYVGGRFEIIGGQPRNNLAAIDLTTGQVTNFDPAGLGTDGPVFALEVSGTQVYVGGRFEKLGGQTRNGLAKVQGTTGGDLGWIPNPSAGAIIRAIEASPNSVYVGGQFTGIGGRPRSNLARLSAVSGAAVAGFAPNPNSAVTTLALSGTTLYAGGFFGSIGGQNRSRVARLDANTGTVALFRFDALPTDRVLTLALAGPALYIGGFHIEADTSTRSVFVKVDANSGAADPLFDPRIGDYDNARINTLAVNGTSVDVGGDFSFVNRVTRRGVAALDADGVPTDFNPDVQGSGGSVHAIAVRDNDVYLGGNFTTVAGHARHLIAKVSKAGSLDLNFNPNPTGGNFPGIYTIVVTSTDVYVGGDFSRIGGQPRLDLARLNPITGLVDGGRQSFDPDPLNGLKPASVRRLQVAGDDVYVCGEFTSIGGRERNKIAKISGTTGDVDVQFDAQVSGGSDLGPAVFDIVLARGTLYVGGDFSSIGGKARRNVATLNPKTGAEVIGFAPNPSGFRAAVYAIEVTDGDIYVGGSFTHANGLEWGGLASFRPSDGALWASFDPQVNGIVLAIAASNSSLYVGGAFRETKGRPRPRYAHFPPYPTQVSSIAADSAAPTSEVQPLDGVQDRAFFAVEWAGEDDDTGVRDYSVFASEDGGPFTPWRTNTSATRAMFLGEDGRIYEFYSLARDRAGNVEAKELAAEASTTIVLRPDDGDGDGVPDALDRCAGSNFSPTVMIDGVDTAAANVLATPAGCTLMDRILRAEAKSLNRRQFARRVVKLTESWLEARLIDAAQAHAIRLAAAESTLLSP